MRKLRYAEEKQGMRHADINRANDNLSLPKYITDCLRIWTEQDQITRKEIKRTLNCQ